VAQRFLPYFLLTGRYFSLAAGGEVSVRWNLL